ncbi:helix-turn-helix transcriptional regulator [Paenibacillus dauci]|uniref:helix-turn-helix transcriptional regulator n=1 Tax=Paenibacillus dauci TaxID=1567106 RepID=UPI000619AF3D|nr:helix-turn-helix transcriptional regulator [Paenibacillus dauci]
MTFFQPLQPPEIQRALLHQGYTYEEYLPAPMLRQVVACYWCSYAAPGAVPQEHRIIPDGCIDIIFDLTAEQLTGSHWISELMCRHEVMQIDHPMHCLGVRIYAGEAARIFGFPAGLLYGNEVTMQDLYGLAANDLIESLLCADQMSIRLSLLDSWLCQRLKQQSMIPSSLFSAALHYIHYRNGNITLPGIAAELHYSERTLRRLFDQELGISPKEIAGIIRFQSLLHSWQRQPASADTVTRLRFSDLAAAHGYYDQSHLNRAFSQYYGLTPGQIRQSADDL